jgi:hypothetical protein
VIDMGLGLGARARVFARVTHSPIRPSGTGSDFGFEYV